MSEPVHAFADQLRHCATHFEFSDWCYTRRTKIRHIRYADDWSGYDHPARRALRTLRRFIRRDRIEREVFGLRCPMAWRHPLIAVRTGLRTPNNLPDGALDNGNVITHWEEHGEYLQYVQPSIGALLADLMDAHPDLLEVQAIAAEWERINDRCAARRATES